jgi:hypothetical protein
MLKSKIAMALAAAMVMAALYGCSSSSDSGLKNDVAALQGTVDMVADALGLDAGASEEDILAALPTADSDQLAAIRALFPELPSNANAAAIVQAINSQVRVVALTADELEAEAHDMEVVAAIRAMNADDTARTRPTGEDAGLTSFSADTNGISINAFSRKFSVGTGDSAVPASDAGAPDAGDVWAGSAFARTDEAETDPAMDEMTFQAFVYSNIKAPGHEEFAEYYAPDDSDGPDAGTPGDAAVSGVDEDGVLSFNEMVGADSALFAGAIVPLAEFQTVPFKGQDDEDTDAKENEFAGSFHGVSGTYTCTMGGTDTCSAATDKDGDLMTLSTGWTFTADEVAEDAEAHMVMGVTADDEYVYFGYWLQVFTDDEGVETIGVNTFTGGVGTAVTALGSIVGTADYSGKAGGKYAVKTLTTMGEIASLNTGQFVADVNLTATFGGGKVAPDDANKLTGTVDKFVATGDGDLRKWEVELKEIALGSLAAGGETTGGGAWSAMFYGASVDDSDTDVDEAMLPPSSVAGTFDGHFADGHVIGAYGATKDAAAE